jgi:hypothetical protein
MRVLKLLVILFIVVIVEHTQAHIPVKPPDFDEKVKSATLIFAGRIKRIEYRSSADLGRDFDVLPHTFVTYSIDKVLKGKTRASEITLRFLGGRGEGARFHLPAEFPLFDSGDTDVVMVVRNGDRSCPLVGCRQGRYRFIDDRVYNEIGREILLNRSSKVVEGHRHELRDVLTHIVSRTTITRRIVNEPGEEPRTKKPIVGTHLTPATFLRHLQERIVKLHTPEELRRLPITETADPSRPFSIRRALPVSASDVRTPITRPGVETPEERAEREALERADGNPVLN